MATQILSPQDCLIERTRFSACRRRNYSYAPVPTAAINATFNNLHNSNPRLNRKPSSIRLSEKRPPTFRRRSNSVDDLRTSRSGNNHHNMGGGNKSLCMEKEKVTILRRGKSLDMVLSNQGYLVVTGTGRLGPDVDVVLKEVRIVDVMSPVAGKAEVYAGSAFVVSPEPSSLPLPSFSKKKQFTVDDSATRDLRRLLRLD